MSWMDKKETFTKRHDDIATYVSGQMNEDITTLNLKIVNYIQSGGVAKGDTNTDYSEIDRITKQIALYKNQIVNLNKEVATAIKEQGENSDMEALLQKNGELQKQIAKAETQKGELHEDAGNAKVRDQALRTKDTNINNRQVYLLGHPLRPASIPYLWGLSILFIGIAVLMLYYYSPIPFPSSEDLIPILIEQFYNPWLWISLLGAASIIILFLILKVMNLLG